jgi:putative ABC transport system permease protein
MDFQVAGLLDSGYKDIDSRYVVMPLPQAQKLLNTERISFWTVKLGDEIDKAAWITDLQREISRTHPELLALDWRQHRMGDLYKKTMSLLNIFRNFVTIVVAFISILSVMNTMVKIVKERTREIGTLLSLGFQRAQVLNIFLLESFFLALFGCFFGAVFSLVMTAVFNFSGLTYKAGILSQPVYFQVLVSPSLYLTALGLLLCVTVLTSFLACRQTIQQKIVECLGHV